MKTKKVVVGALAAMLSLSVCSLAPAVAAGETVQISVGKKRRGRCSILGGCIFS